MQAEVRRRQSRAPVTSPQSVHQRSGFPWHIAGNSAALLVPTAPLARNEGFGKIRRAPSRVHSACNKSTKHRSHLPYQIEVRQNHCRPLTPYLPQPSLREFGGLHCPPHTPHLTQPSLQCLAKEFALSQQLRHPPALPAAAPGGPTPHC